MTSVFVPSKILRACSVSRFLFFSPLRLERKREKVRGDVPAAGAEIES